jgi:hypothetical protein
MRPVKILGASEAAALRKRALSAHALGRISRSDADYIVERCDEILDRIAAMRETDEDGEEVG